MPKAKLHRIPEPAPQTRAVFVTDNNSPTFVFVRGQGAWDYQCEKCGRTLLKKVLKDQVKGMVLKCPGCGEHNDTQPSPN